MTGVTDEAEIEAIEATATPPWQLDDRTIHQRMVDVLAEMPAIGKTSENTQQHFMFRSHDDVLNALNPLMAKHGVFVVPEVVERITGERTTGGGKTMYEINLLVRYTFYGAEGGKVVASSWGEGTDMGDKATSKAMTMAFKTVLAQSFAVSTEESYDADAGSPEDTTRSAAQAPRGQSRPRAEAAPEMAIRPRSWAEWTNLMKEFGVIEVEALEWVAQAAAVKGIDKQTQEGKDETFRGAVVALNALAEAAKSRGGTVQFTVGARAIIKAAFKAGFGVEVDGPVWRLDPEETDRSSYAEHQAAMEKLGAE